MMIRRNMMRKRTSDDHQHDGCSSPKAKKFATLATALSNK
jgi:hypothetical protein